MCTSTPPAIKQFDVTDPKSKIRGAGRKLEKGARSLFSSPEAPALPDAAPEAQVAPDYSTMFTAKKKKKPTLLADIPIAKPKTLLGE